MRRLATVLTLAIAAFLAPVARAATIPALGLTLQMGSNTPVAMSGSSVDNGDGTFTFNGSQSTPGWTCSWNWLVDPDPLVHGNFTVTNNTAVTQTFTLTVTLPVSVSAPWVMGGSTVQILTDNTGDGATMGTLAGSAFYRAMVNGGFVSPPNALGNLFPDNSSFSVGSFLSGSDGGASFGTPIPSAPGNPLALTSIGIQFQFTLTPGDSASTQGVFVVQPVPEPGSMLLLGMGLAGLGLVRRRK